MQRAQAEGLAVTDEELNAADPRDSGVPGERALLAQALPGHPQAARVQPGGVRERDPARADARQGGIGGPRRRQGDRRPSSSRRFVCAVKRCARRGPWSSWRRIVAAASVTDEELAAYLAKHPDEFRQPDRRRVQYVTLSPKDFTPTVTDAEVEKYYTRARQGVRDARDRFAPRTCWSASPRRAGSEAEDKAREQDRRRHPPGEGGGGLRQARAASSRKIPGPRRAAATSGCVSQRRDGAAVRAGAVRVEEGRSISPSRCARRSASTRSR